MKLKSILLIAHVGLFAWAASAQELTTIPLNAPSKERGSNVMEALANRRSTREFSTEKLSLQDLSDLLWAANGVNRPDGRRTAATARNNQDIDVYVVMEEASYCYDAQNHALVPVAAGDHRGLIADAQTSVKAAPVSLLMVSDLARFVGLDPASRPIWGALDAGIVSQNIMLFASACGLVTVPRVYMKKEELKTVLKLSETQIPMINNPVGYPKK
jgi:nitroreductase